MRGRRLWIPFELPRRPGEGANLRDGDDPPARWERRPSPETRPRWSPCREDPTWATYERAEGVSDAAGAAAAARRVRGGGAPGARLSSQPRERLPEPATAPRLRLCLAQRCRATR